MIRRDYIIQLIKRAAPSLKKLFALRQVEKQAESQAVLQAALKELLNLDANLVLGMASKDLQDLLNMDPGQATGKGFVVAELLAEYAEAAEAQGRADAARDCRQKAGDFYRWVAALPGGREHVDSSIRAPRCLDSA
jgi:hypothetical protein